MGIPKLVEIAEIASSKKPYHRKMPDTRNAITHDFVITGQTGAVEGSITAGLYEDGTLGEIFIDIAKEGSTVSGLVDGFAKAVSQGLQYGVPLAKIVEMHKNVRFEPFGSTRNSDIPEALSLIDYIVRWLELKFLDSDAAL